jgi:hypothetical protein
MLAQVSRHDLRTTEQLWETSVALCMRSQTGTPVSCCAVLRKEPDTNPVCYAYAYARCLDALRRFRRNLSNTVSFGIWNRGGSFVEFLIFPGVSRAAGGGAVSSVSHTSTAWGQLYLQPLLGQGAQSRYNITLTRLLDMFVLRGQGIDYICSHVIQDAETTISFWREIGVDQELRIYTESPYTAEQIRQSPAFHAFSPHVHVQTEMGRR